MRIIPCIGLALLALSSACPEVMRDSTFATMCDVDDDCTGLNPICDFRSSRCVATCEDNSSCAGNFPVCNADGANSQAPAVCICDENSCPSGRACLPDGDCDINTMCGTPGVQAGCQLAEVCLPAGGCATACDNEGSTGCLSQASLCDPNVGRDTFNSCVRPQLATTSTSCPNAASHARAADGPIIVAGVRQAQLAMGAFGCTGTPIQFVTDVFLPEGSNGLPTDLVTNIRQLDAAGNPVPTFTGGTAMPSVRPVAGSGDRFLVDFWLCVSTASASQPQAVFLQDTDGQASNAACVSAE